MRLLLSWAHFKCQLVVKCFCPRPGEKEARAEKNFLHPTPGCRQAYNVEIIIIYNYQCHGFMTCSSINALDSSTTSSWPWQRQLTGAFRIECPRLFRPRQTFPGRNHNSVLHTSRAPRFRAKIDSNCVAGYVCAC